MRTLIFATNNDNKAEEIRSVLKGRFTIMTLKEAGITIDIPEPHPTIEENAFEKSSVIHALTGNDCFSEDTGLEVTALNGEPGVRSARYAGDNADFKNNIAKLLSNMDGIIEREAQFKTVISLIINDSEYRFEGICKGMITTEMNGNMGFGYDPIFIPQGSDQTFAQMSMDEKNKFSHRKKAVEKLITFLNRYDAENKN